MSLLALLCLASVVRAQDPLLALQTAHLGVRTHSMEGRITHLLGEMTTGATAEEAVAQFLGQHGRVFGAGEIELLELWRAPIRGGDSEVFAYRQYIRGTEVVGSMVGVMVERGDPQAARLPRVGYAAAKVAGEPTTGREVPLFPAAMAVALAKAHPPGYSAFVVHGEPRTVVLRGSGARPTAWCWQVTLVGGGVETRASHTFYVDTALGQVVRVVNNISSAQDTPDPTTTGIVEALGLELGGDWFPYRGPPPASALDMLRIPGARVEGQTGVLTGHTFTNDLGAFRLTLGNWSDPITFNLWLQGLQDWYVVHEHEQPGNPIPLQKTVQTTVGADEDVELDSSLNQARKVATASVVHTVHRGRQFILQYMPGVELEEPILLHPNVSQPPVGGCVCNAGYLPSRASLNQYDMPLLTFRNSHACQSCWHYGNHSVAAHEYGHYALDMVDPDFYDLQTHYFHEGYADSFHNMLNDTNVQGPMQLRNPDRNSRDDPTSELINCQYPIEDNITPKCYCQEHHAGRLLSGVWVRIREQYKSTYGNETGLESAREVFGDWTLVTVGMEDGSCNPAHPGTLMEVYSVGADEGIACSSFQSHNIACPF